MIVKKMLISQGFPAFETVKYLSELMSKNVDFRPVFYDVETTGLSRNSTFLYLIGAAAFDGEAWYIYQWMAESPKEEVSILKAFSEFMEQFTCIISYNGDHFDAPYLEARYTLYDLPYPFSDKESLDLYLHLKPLKKILKLSTMKQPCLEEFLGIRDRIFCDGKECIRIYKEFLKKRQVSDADTVLGHNLEDVLGLGKIYMMLSYLFLYSGNYEVSHAELEDDHLLLSLSLSSALPAAFSNGNEHFYITGKENTVRLIIKASEGRFRQYYANYKDYNYLPAEDTAIPKVLSSCIDKKLRKAATKDTCYTWFSCTDAFLSDSQAQKRYLEHTLPYLLGTLK